MIVCISKWAGIKFSTFVDGRGIRNQIHPFVAGLTRSGALPFDPPSVAARRRRNSWRIVQSNGVEWCFGQMCAICLKCF